MGMCPVLSGVDLDGNLVKIPCETHDCEWYIQAQGVHPQTGATISEYDCSKNWDSVFLIENAKLQRQTASAIESLRNETMAHQDAYLSASQADKQGIRAVLMELKTPGSVEVLSD